MGEGNIYMRGYLDYETCRRKKKLGHDRELEFMYRKLTTKVQIVHIKNSTSEQVEERRNVSDIQT